MFIAGRGRAGRRLNGGGLGVEDILDRGQATSGTSIAGTSTVGETGFVLGGAGFSLGAPIFVSYPRNTKFGKCSPVLLWVSCA